MSPRHTVTCPPPRCLVHTRLIGSLGYRQGAKAGQSRHCLGQAGTVVSHQVPPHRRWTQPPRREVTLPFKPKSPQTTGQDRCPGLRSPLVNVASVLIGQSGPNPIMPENGEFIWGIVSVALLLVPVVFAVLVVRYLIQSHVQQTTRLSKPLPCVRSLVNDGADGRPEVPLPAAGAQGRGRLQEQRSSFGSTDPSGSYLNSALPTGMPRAH
jgi:hypothetical protein